MRRDAISALQRVAEQAADGLPPVAGTHEGMPAGIQKIGQHALRDAGLQGYDTQFSIKMDKSSLGRTDQG